MYTIYNNVEDYIVFNGIEREFIDFVKKIVIKNKTSDYSIIGVGDAIEYITDYCDDLKLI